MISSAQAARLQRTIHGETRGNGDNGPLADCLDAMFAIACEETDPDDIYQAAEALVDAATRARDEADAAIMNAQAISAANRGDDLRLDLMGVV